MPKIIFVIFACLLAASCRGFSPQNLSPTDKKTDQNQQVSTNGEQTNSKKEPFETLVNEEAAEEVDKKTQDEIEEVEVKDRVFFGDNIYQVSDEARRILDVQAEWLKSDEKIKIIIEGHCDERGTREYNIALGERRANAVKKYLMSVGVNSRRIKTISYGKERPAFFGSDNATMAKNRRAVTLPQN